ncbi:MAG: CsgG/HfaB family protein [Gemmatimonadota bacterium]
MFRRIMSATAIAASLHVPGAGLAAQAADRPVVAILDFTNSALVDHERYEPFSAGIAGMLLADLRQNPRIELVERERIRDLLDEIELSESGRVDPEAAVEAGRILGAHHVIVGGFVIDPQGNLRLDARAVSVETSRIEHVETVEDDVENLLRAVTRLGRQLSASLDLPMDDSELGDPRPARPGQVLANLKYARALLEEDRENAARALELYRQFLAETPPDYALVLRREARQRIRVLMADQGG